MSPLYQIIYLVFGDSIINRSIPHRERGGQWVVKRAMLERLRIKQFTAAFKKLRDCVPFENGKRKASHLETIRQAINHITTLQNRLKKEDKEGNKEPNITKKQKDRIRRLTNERVRTKIMANAWNRMRDCLTHGKPNKGLKRMQVLRIAAERIAYLQDQIPEDERRNIICREHSHH